MNAICEREREKTKELLMGCWGHCRRRHLTSMHTHRKKRANNAFNTIFFIVKPVCLFPLSLSLRHKRNIWFIFVMFCYMLKLQSRRGIKSQHRIHSPGVNINLESLLRRSMKLWKFQVECVRETIKMRTRRLCEAKELARGVFYSLHTNGRGEQRSRVRIQFLKRFLEQTIVR